MGRTFSSIRLGVNNMADRWARSARALKKEGRKYGERLVELVKTHSSEAFVACDDPLEAVVFSALVEIFKRQDRLEAGVEKYVDS
ncbi:MAG: hypothetical protein WCC86_08975 [Methanoregula sp.]|uniref:hypothetical protein n=1 Tax=Methanoregula sp. TaxID=2052170 RepID=UPI003BB0AF5C